MSKSRATKKRPDKSEENDQESEAQADYPDERLRDFLQGRFPERLPLSQSPKGENPDDVEDRKPEKRGKKPVPVQKQLPKSKEK